MSKQDLVKIYQAKKAYLQLGRNKDQMYDKVFATFEMNAPGASSKIQFDVLIELDEAHPGYGIYYGCRIKNIKKGFVIPSVWCNSIVPDLESILAKVNLPADLDVVDGEIWAFSVRLNDDEPANKAREGVCTIIKYFQQKLQSYGLTRLP